MNRTKKIAAFMLMLVIALSAGLLTACGGNKGGDPSEIKIWVAAADVSYIQGKVNNYMAQKETDFFVTVSAKEEDQVNGALTEDATAAADIFSLPIDQIAELAGQGMLNRITTAAANRLQSGDSQVTANAILGASAKDQNGTAGYFGFPYSIETYFMYYDSQAFQASDLASFETIYAKGTFTFPFNVAFHGAAPFLTMVEGNPFKRAGIGGATQNEFVIDIDDATEAAWAARTAMMNPNYVESDNADLMITKMEDGSARAGVSGVWVYDQLKAIPTIGPRIKLAALPSMNIGGQNRPLKSFENYKYFSVNAGKGLGGDKLAMVMDIAEWLASKEMQIDRFINRGNIPCNLAAQESDEITGNNIPAKSKEVLEATLAQLENGSILNCPPGTFWNAFEALLTNEQFVSDSLTKAQMKVMVQTTLNTIKGVTA